MIPVTRKTVQNGRTASVSVGDDLVAVALTTHTSSSGERHFNLSIHAAFRAYQPGDSVLNALREDEEQPCVFLPGERCYGNRGSILAGREWMARFPFSEDGSWPTEAGWLDLEQQHAKAREMLLRLRVDDPNTEIGQAFLAAQVTVDRFRQALRKPSEVSW